MQETQTGFVIFLNHDMMDWFSKKQSTIETSVFGTEVCAVKHGIETLCGICYKLRMMGVPVSGPSYVFSDNMSFVTNVSKPESTLRKKSYAICYHAEQVAIAMGKALVAHFTKVLYGLHQCFLVSRMMWDVYPMVECQGQPLKTCR